MATENSTLEIDQPTSQVRFSRDSLEGLARHYSQVAMDQKQEIANARALFGAIAKLANKTAPEAAKLARLGLSVLRA
ncbi:MAG: hypothetical protein JNK06_15640 [Candidatus Accumulibacter phosphatis]|uniref:hypothetical protein n=1 Tax=Candidatus Accumulibacter phosphatis TaxID=327160 RepID=UPI001A39418C|nr:hypothetical protein [Candidatus Accumulibacter phosphatis]